MAGSRVEISTEADQKLIKNVTFSDRNYRNNYALNAVYSPIRAFIISNIFRGVLPRGGRSNPLPHPSPARLRRARGRFAPPAPQTQI